MQRPLPLRAASKTFQSALDSAQGLLVRAEEEKLWQSLTHPKLALAGGTIGVVGLLLNGPMTAIAVVALGVGLTIYLHQLDRLHVTWLPWQRWWRPANRPLTLALIGVAGTAIAGGCLLQLWQRSPWPGLTILVIAQTLIMATVLWRRGADSFFGETAPQSPAPTDLSPPAPQPVEPILMALAATHPIHQLVAIRRALSWAKTTSDPTALNDIADCFVLMLCHHPDPIVQSALQQGLQQLSALSLTPYSLPKPGAGGPDETATGPATATSLQPPQAVVESGEERENAIAEVVAEVMAEDTETSAKTPLETPPKTPMAVAALPYPVLIAD